MSIPPTGPAAPGSANPLHINLSAPPVGTRTTITLERNSATSGVAVTTESTLISDFQEEASGIIGCCMGYVKRTWASICNWFLYVFHFFFPPSALSAITQVEQNLERTNHEQRRWMEERQREIVDMLTRGRPAEPPVVGGVPTIATGVTTGAPSIASRPTMASLRIGNDLRQRLMAAQLKLAEIRVAVEAVTEDQVRNSQWTNAAAFKQDYRDTLASAEGYLRDLNDFARYTQEGTEDKSGNRAPVAEIPDVVGVEQHTFNISNLLNPPSYTAVLTGTDIPGGVGSGITTFIETSHN